jgi:SAM-dependent methyltransferase
VTAVGPAAAPAVAVDPGGRGVLDDEVLDGLRRRLERMVLHELQTGGGLTLEHLTGATRRPGADPSPHVPAIRAALAALRASRDDAPRRAAELLSAGGVPRRVLDVGAGRAPWSLALAALSGDVEVVALDLPARRSEVADAVDRAGLTSQFQLVDHDMLAGPVDALPPFDVVVVANVCHLFPAPRTQLLLSRAAAALRPGGTLAVIDQLLDDAPDWRRWAALYAVGAPHWGPGGHLFTPGEYAAWLRGAGLTEVRVDDLCLPPPISLVTARS